MVALTSGMSNTCRTHLHRSRTRQPTTATRTGSGHMIDHRVRGIAAAQRKPLPTRLLTRLASCLTSLRARRAALQPITRRRPRGVRRVLPQPVLELHDPRLQLLDHRVSLGQQPKELFNGGRRVRHRARRPATNPRIRPTRRSHQHHQSHQRMNGYTNTATRTFSVSQRGGGLQMPTNGVRVCNWRVGPYCAGCLGQTASIRMRAESEL